MRSMTAEDSAHLSSYRTTWAVCVRFKDRDGTLYLQTAHDADIVVNKAGIEGTYKSIFGVNTTGNRSTADLSVDNLDVESVMDDLGITQAAIEAGMFDDIEYTMFLVNWQTPLNSGIVFRKGKVGNIVTFLKSLANVELRGLKQAFTQQVVRTCQVACDADLFDHRCRLVKAAFTQSSSVIDIPVPRFTLKAAGVASDAGHYTFGLLKFTTGNNAGFSREIKVDSGGGEFTFIEAFPSDFELGDEFEITPGCDKSLQTCKEKFNNVVNHRGHPYIPGRDAQLRVGGQ